MTRVVDLVPLIVVQDFRREHPRVRMAPGRVGDGGEPPRFHGGVVVKEHDVPAARGPDSLVIPLRKSPVVGKGNEADRLAVLLQDPIRRPVRRTVVHKDRLKVHGSLGKDRVEAFHEKVSAVPVEDDD